MKKTSVKSVDFILNKKQEINIFICRLGLKNN